jgi:hypothetical protein
MPNDSIVTNSGLLDSNVVVRTHQDTIHLRRIAGEALCFLVWRWDAERIPYKKENTPMFQGFLIAHLTKRRL